MNIVIDGVEYTPKVPIESESDKNVASKMIGKKVIVRSYNEGLNIGEVVNTDATGIELKNVRRLYYHKPKDSNLSWYEGVAVSGLSDDSKVSGTVPRKIIIEKYSMTEVTDEIFNSIMGKNPNGS